MKTDKRPTDEDILAMTKVPVQVAADYLDMSPDTIRAGLITGELPFGSAVKLGNAQRTTFDIRPLALVEYNRHGTGNNVNTNLAADEIARKIIKRIQEAGI